MASPPISVILPRYCRPAADEKRQCAGTDERQAAEAGVKYEPLGNSQFSAAVYRINQRPISRPKKKPTDPYRSGLVKLSSALNWRPLAILSDSVQFAGGVYPATSISVIRKQPRKSRGSARGLLHGTSQRPLSHDAKKRSVRGADFGPGIRYVNGVTSDRLNTHTCRPIHRSTWWLGRRFIQHY